MAYKAIQLECNCLAMVKALTPQEPLKLTGLPQMVGFVV